MEENKVDTFHEQSVKCPRCKEDIDYLKAFCFEQNKYRVSLTDSYHGTRPVTLDWSTSEVIESSATKTEFECPGCKETLFTVYGGGSNPQVVIDFLKGVRMTWVKDVDIQRYLADYAQVEGPKGSYYAAGFPRGEGDVGIYFVDPTSTERGMTPVK